MNTLLISNQDLKTGQVDAGLYQALKYLGKIQIVGQGQGFRKVKGDPFYLERLSANKKARQVAACQALGAL